MAIPPLKPKHTEERLKLAANGLQALALTVFAAAILGPSLNASLVVPIKFRIIAGILIGGCEWLAYTLLRYIPFP